MHPDIFIQNYIVGIRSASVTEWMYLASRFFDSTPQFFLFMSCMAIFIYFIRGVRWALLFCVALVSSGTFVALFKWLFNASRPVDYVVSGMSGSFPSYHATIATTFFIILMYIFDGGFSRPTRILFNALCIFSILFVSFSRVYLGAHWFSDVVCGIILGALVSYLAVLVFNFVIYRRGNASMIK